MASSYYYNNGQQQQFHNGQQQRAVNRNCSVFVGNIPYEASEEELREIFSRVGPVISFRLMKDKETGMPKGYGFCEYRDMETAYSAMRNLSNADYGGRPLRVDWADHELRNSEAVTKVLRTSNAEVSERTEKIVKDRLQEFRGKITDETIELAVSDMQPFREISTLIDLLTPEQLVHLLAELQRLSLTDPDTCKALLSTQPQLRVAIAFALVRINVITDPLNNNNTRINKSSLLIGRQDMMNKRQRLNRKGYDNKQEEGGGAIPPPPWSNMVIGGHHHGHNNNADENNDDEDDDDRINNNDDSYDVTQLTSDEKMKVIEQFSSLSTDEISDLPPQVRESMETLVREWVIQSQGGQGGEGGEGEGGGGGRDE